ncbi:MFS transporter [Mycolicibacterium setense]|uniref:MFS transporter n=1 Tax=Mycolicibacterium setense TaxID=431269 RepID=UPI001F41D1A1|nr:MFS transporter [Mycolicibacterium setense]
MAPKRSAAITLTAAYLGLFIGLVDANAVNLALPAIAGDLGGGVAGAQWTIDAYNVTFAAFLLTAGSLGDRFSRRRMLRIGLATFVGASIACAIAPSLTLLLVARAIQGVGAAMMLPQGLAIAAAAFPDPRGRRRAPRICRIRTIRTLGASTYRVSVWPSWRSVPRRWCWSRDTIGIGSRPWQSRPWHWPHSSHSWASSAAAGTRCCR